MNLQQLEAIVMCLVALAKPECRKVRWLLGFIFIPASTALFLMAINALLETILKASGLI